MPHVETSDLRIYYERNGSGCSVLFIGGVGGDLRSRPNVFDSASAKGFERLACDQRGTGPLH